nr:hypothetical protein [Gammaproteobacteria bacterium]
GGAAEVEQEVVRTSQEMADSEKASRPARNRPRVKSLRQRMNGLTKLFKRRTASVVVQPHLSEQLQRRVRQHLNTSLRKARQGDIANAKLYANLASNAVHELTKYMSKDDFNRFNTQICADLKEFRDRDIFKPLNEMLN